MILECRDEIDMSAGEMVDESIVGQACRATSIAAAAERGKPLAARTKLHAIPKNRFQDAELDPLLQDGFRVGHFELPVA